FDPLLATQVPTPQNGGISADGRTYTFQTRKGVKFHDGTPFSAEDVKYSLMRFCLQDRDGGPSSLLLEPILGISSTRKDGTPIASLYKDLDKAITVDGDTVKVTLATPFAPFLSIL